MPNLQSFSKCLFDKTINDMEWWIKSLEKEYSDNPQTVSFLINKLERFFGEEMGDSIRVLVLTSASPADVQGGTISNYIESDSPFYKNIDKSVWGIDMCFPLLEYDSREKSPLHPVRSVFSSMVHESMHLRLQKRKFFNLIKEVEKEKDIQDIMKVLKENSGSYMNITMELITQYATSYIERGLDFNISYTRVRKPFDYILDYELFNDVISNNILSFVKHEKLDGPMSRLFNNWVNLVGYIPEEIADEYYDLKDREGNKLKNKDWRENKINIYKMAYQLDLSLMNEYMERGKEIDKEFVLKLYKLIGEILPKID